MGTGAVPGKGGTAGTAGAAGAAGTGGRGGTAGTSGTVGKGGVGGRGGTTPTGGTSVGGDGGFGGGDCGPSLTSRVVRTSCSINPSCESTRFPLSDQVTRNEPAVPGSGGFGGEGGAGSDPGGEGQEMASALLCALGDNPSGYLAVDYYTGESANPGFTLLRGSGGGCEGYEIASATFNDYARPTLGTWTKQCVALVAEDLDEVWMHVITHSPFNRVRNVRFVSSCTCPRQITRYTTCGDMTSARYCQ